MPGWLDHILGLAEKLVPAPILDLIGAGVAGVAGVLSGLTGNVSGAWHDFAVALDALRAGHFELTTALEGVLGQIIGHWLPKYAITAWWWVTHPDQLAEQLSLYVVRWLEREAWTIAPYLGKFLLALVVRNIRRWLPILESILVAIL